MTDGGKRREEEGGGGAGAEGVGVGTLGLHGIAFSPPRRKINIDRRRASKAAPSAAAIVIFSASSTL